MTMQLFLKPGISQQNGGAIVNTVRLTVRGELVEPPATHQEPFDRLRANGIFLNQTVLEQVLH